MRDGCILMHFHTCCILDMLHSYAFSCIQKVRFMLMHSPRDAYVAWRIVMHFDAVVLAASLRIPNTVHSYVLLCICSALHSTWVAFKCICMPPHIRCILSTRCILTHSHSYAFKRIQMHSLTHAFTSVRRCIHSCMLTRVCIRWRLGWHVVAHGCSIGTPYGRMARPQPVQPIPVHVSLAFSPLGSSCVSMCGPWCILAHSDAFVCINVHSCAFLRIMKRVDRAPALIQIVRKSGIFPPKWTEIHNNAHKCITGRMQHIQNAPSWECVGMCWNALRCGMYRMQHT
jgi:hypothetical protein